jgi:predicted ester cyclase
MNKQIVQRFFELVFNEGNMAVVDQTLSPNYSYNGGATSAGGTKAWAQGLRTTFPDLHFAIESILAEDDKVALRWRMTGTDQASKQPVYASGTNILVMVSGQALTNDQGGGTEFLPVPAITSISPSTAAVGGADFTLTVNGSGFIPSSVVQWGGSNRATSFVSPTQLAAAIKSADVATAATVNVTVFNGTPAEGCSNRSAFTVK